MPHRQIALSWRYDLRRARARVLGAMYLVGGLLCLGSGLFGQVPDARYAVTLVIGAVAVLVSAVLIVAGERFPPAVVQGLLAGYSLLIGVLAVASVRVVGVVSLGPAVIGGAMYAGYFLTGVGMWSQVTLGMVSYVAGGAISAAHPEIVSLVSVIVTGVAVAAILNRLTQELLARSTLDSLTGTVSRSAWLQAAEQSLRRPEGDDLCVAIIDLDDFKAVNDASGHLAGDELLRQAAGAWKVTLGRSGLVGRYGGDEFVVLMPQLTLPEARRSLVRMVDAHPAKWTSGLAVRRPDDTVIDLLQRADVALLEAKRARDLDPADEPG